jgi:hypothetical protein
MPQLVLLTGVTAGGGGGSSSSTSNMQSCVSTTACIHIRSKPRTSTTKHGMLTAALRSPQPVLLWWLHLKMHATMLLKQQQQLQHLVGWMSLMQLSA